MRWGIFWFGLVESFLLLFLLLLFVDVNSFLVVSFGVGRVGKLNGWSLGRVGSFPVVNVISRVETSASFVLRKTRRGFDGRIESFQSRDDSWNSI